MKTSSKKQLASIFLLGLTILAFWPSLFNGFIHWDDSLLLTNNPLIVSSGHHHLSEFFTMMIGKTYIPLTTLSFFIEYHFFKLNPFIYHLDNLLLHCIAVLFVFKICLQLGLSLRASIFAAVLFSIHPMRVESIAWIAERKDVLCACFYTMAIYQYLIYIQTFKKSNYFLCLFFSLLSILSKPMALSLPLILFLIDWFTQRKTSRRSILEKIPFLLFNIFFAHITYSYFTPVGISSSKEAILIWSWTFMFYIFKFMFPLHLSPIYLLPAPLTLTHGEYLSALAGFSIFIFSLIYFRKNRWWIFACLFYILSIFFLLHFNASIKTMPVGDRYMYLPSLGFCLFIGWLMDDILNKIHGIRSKILLYSVLVLTAGCLIGKSFTQSMVWRDELSFWTFINKQSSGYLPLIHLGDYYEHHQGDHAKAIEYYKEALDKDPANDFWLYQNIGIVYLLQKDYDRALSCFEHSLLLNPQSPEGYMLKASVHEARNEYDLAFENYSQAIRYNPDFAQAYHNRAIIYCRRGSLNQAIEDLTKAIHLIPDFWTAYYFRGQIYAILGQKNKASDDFNAVLKIKPNDVAAIKYRSLLENNTLPPHRLDIPDDTYDQPQWDSTGYKNYLPDKDRFYKLVS